MVQKSYKQENIIGFADVDYRERLRPFRVFELLEDISDVHANILEIGAQSPVMEGYVWVVARNRYQLTRMPRLGEKITFDTWPGQCQRAIYPRLFSMTDESGCRIGGVHSIWTLLDVKKQRLAVNPKINAMFPDTEDLGVPVQMPRKLKQPQPTRPPVYYTPAYSDLDRNRHVNNARYISWVCDCFAPERYENQTILDLEINYFQQAFAGEKIRMEIDEQGASFLIQGNNDETDVPLFRAAGTFAKSE